MGTSFSQQELNKKVVYKELGCTGGYSYIALSELPLRKPFTYFVVNGFRFCNLPPQLLINEATENHYP
jgi:hypothetical protein